MASAYEQFRPGYPDELVDEVLTYAGRPVRTALEIGAGTGKATRVFAGRGIAVTATDPDAAMLTELRKHVPATVATVQGAFEDLPLTSTYDLVFAAASLHWTEAANRWSCIAALLNPGGVFASFGGQVCLADIAVDEAVRAARSQFLADDGVPSPDGTPTHSPMQWPGTELAQSRRFIDVRQSTIERRTTMSARDYIGHLSTISAYLELPASVREHAFDRILGVLPERVMVMADPSPCTSPGLDKYNSASFIRRPHYTTDAARRLRRLIPPFSAFQQSRLSGSPLLSTGRLRVFLREVFLSAMEGCSIGCAGPGSG